MSDHKDLNFVQGFMNFCANTEVPQMFAAWSAIAGISAILGRRTYIEFGAGNIYPNMYITLVAGSGQMRKSTSIDMISDMLREIKPGPNIVAQKLTPEALIDSLKVVHTEDPAHFMKVTCTGFILADELATFLNKQSYEAGIAPLLIQFFDCKASWEYRTKSGGSQVLTDLCLGMIAGSTIDWLSSAIPTNAVGGGLTSRIVFVYVDQPAAPVPYPVMSDETRSLRLTLINHLNRLARLEGMFKLTDSAMSFYKKEYMRFYNGDDGHTFFNNPTLRGYASRRHIHQLKLSMLLSAAEDDARIIEDRHIAGATQFLSLSEKHMSTVLNMITSTELGLLQKQFIDMIMRSPVNPVTKERRVSKSLILRVMGHRVTLRELDETINSLKISHGLTEVISGKEIFYVLKDRNDPG